MPKRREKYGPYKKWMCMDKSIIYVSSNTISGSYLGVNWGWTFSHHLHNFMHSNGLTAFSPYKLNWMNLNNFFYEFFKVRKIRLINLHSEKSSALDYGKNSKKIYGIPLKLTNECAFFRWIHPYKNVRCEKLLLTSQFIHPFQCID